MAEGVRIQPRPGLNWPGDASVCVTDHSRPYPQPRDGSRLEDVQPVCPLCGHQHFAKTYRIQMRRGSAIVSATVWENLQRLDDNPFVYANPVPAPPGQIIRPSTRGGVQHVEWVEKFVMPITTNRST